MANPAYDLERFAPRYKQQPEAEIKVLKQPKHHAHSVEKVHPVKTLLSCVAVVLVFFAVMYSRAVYTELSSEVTEAASTLAELKSEETRLNLGIEGMVSMRRVEEYAQNELGLVKAENYQMTYMTLSNEDKVEINEKNEGVFDFLARLVTGCLFGQE